ncbi:hypothetical protein [Paraburkholderia bannensis]|uniref:hypothetical protein n=1 Tax=Paraburkholderia bannensis TaxID=765414 RepID=UPI002AB1B163|nr:hypothetical protein [Paraburkholderia bannensis]
MSEILTVALLFVCAGAHAQEARVTNVAPVDAAQIKSTIAQFYALPYIDASCRFSHSNADGKPTDKRVYDRNFRNTRYTKTFKSLFSASLFATLAKRCVDDPQAPAMQDPRISDSEIDTVPGFQSDTLRMKLLSPPLYLETNSTRVRVRLNWAELLRGSNVPTAIGRTDMVLLKASDGWRIDDAWSLGYPGGAASDFDMSSDDFVHLPNVVHLRAPT